MLSPKDTSLLVAFIATLLAAFLGMFWNQLEPRFAFPDGTKVMLVVAVLAAATSRMVGNSPTGLTIFMVGVAVPIGVFLNAMVGIVRDPSSNNLWPISVFMTGVLGVIALQLALAWLGCCCG